MTDLRLTTVNLGAPDAPALARFYERLLGWRIDRVEDGFVVVRDPGGGVSLACQREDRYTRPVWPAGKGDQQMQLHLEIAVTDLDAAVQHARECGAEVAGHQPQDDVRVCLDPVGHPFCLYLDAPA